MSLVSDIKLIRTDTTLDLSQKAEKGMHLCPLPTPLIATSTMCLSSPERMGQTNALPFLHNHPVVVFTRNARQQLQLEESPQA
jgi:hypothetical protein